MECKLLLDAVLELLALFEGKRVGLCNDRDNVDGLAELLEDDNIDGLEAMARGRNEVETAVDAGVLDVAGLMLVNILQSALAQYLPLTLSSQFLPEVSRVLVLDVLDDRVPAAVVVDEVTVARGVDDVQAQSHAVLLNDVGDGLDLSGLSGGLGGCKAALRFDEVGGEDGVNQGGLAETGLACIEMIVSESLQTLSSMPFSRSRARLPSNWPDWVLMASARQYLAQLPPSALSKDRIGPFARH